MSAGLLILTPLVPILLAAVILRRRLVGTEGGLSSAWVAPLAALPGLALALYPGSVPDLRMAWMFLGVQIGLDEVGRVFLLLTSVLWMLGGLFAGAYMAPDPRRTRYDVFFLLTMSGNLGVVIARDLATFYAAFATMTFAAYGLVVHSGSVEAHRAGRVYIVLALVGEALLVGGFLLAASAGGIRLDGLPGAVAAAPFRDAALVLLLAGFGIKVGAAFLHVWLPLAHPVAPTPASAVLSGAIIKAGVLGWLRFLPLGEVAMPLAGAVVIAAGLVAAYGAVVVGATQRDAKTTLAYSSVSQMGLITIAVGIGLMHPNAWPLAGGAVLLSALHHAMAKGALFLGVGVAGHAGSGPPWSPRLLMLGLGVPMLALAGAPWTGGALAKGMLKEAASLAPGGWPAVLEVALPLAAVGTTVLMARFVLLVWEHVARRRDAGTPHDTPGGAHEAVHGPGGARPVGIWVPWLASVLAAGLLPVAAAGPLGLTAAAPADALAVKLWPALWPIGVGIGLAAGLASLEARRGALPEIPAGDALALYVLGIARTSRAALRVGATAHRILADGIRSGASLRSDMRRLSGRLRSIGAAAASLSAAGTVWLLLTAVLLAALWLGASHGR